MSRSTMNSGVGALLLLSLFPAGSVGAATQDQEQLVDPTIPLELVLSERTSSSNSSLDSAIDLFGVFTSYELSSVLIRAEDRIAVINDERVRIGDKVGQAVVTSIEPDHVTLNVDGDVQTLNLYETSIKTRVTGDD